MSLLHGIPARLRSLGDSQVKRVLPHARLRKVGPWVFVDHFGPEVAPAGTGSDVRPHPHCGLSTVSWLFAAPSNIVTPWGVMPSCDQARSTGSVRVMGSCTASARRPRIASATFHLDAPYTPQDRIYLQAISKDGTASSTSNVLTIDVSRDFDGDGLTTWQENFSGTDPEDEDHDKDGVIDGVEVFTHATDPAHPDSDGGGVTDGAEITRGTDPKDPNDDLAACEPEEPAVPCANTGDCDDGSPCTDDYCSTITSECVYLNNTDSCTGSDLCTNEHQCYQGECVTSQVDCDDNKDCTLDTCDPLDGSCNNDLDLTWVETSLHPGITLSNGCVELGAIGESGYDGVEGQYMVWGWAGMTGQGAPAGWSVVNHCTQSALYSPNPLGYWPSLLRKDC